MIKIIPNQSVYLGSDADGNSTAFAELICDTASELVGLTELDGVAFAFGSMALAAKEGKLCIFASDGTWYCDGEEVTADV